MARKKAAMSRCRTLVSSGETGIERARFEKICWHLGNQEFICEKDAIKAAKAAIKALRFHSAQVNTQSFNKSSKRGRPKQDDPDRTILYRAKVSLLEDEAEIRAHRAKLGRFILATNELDESKLSNAEMLNEYKSQNKTEQGFRFIKGDAFEVASVFLKKPERVEALMVVMTLCLLVYNFAQHKLRKTLESLNETVPNQIKKPTAKPTMAWICRMFHGVHLLRVDHGSQGVQEIVINLTELTRRIIRYFGMVAERIYGLAYG